MPNRFPWWIPLGALALAAGYLPTLTAPFDFIDDGNLVYPAPPGTSFAGHVERWWDKVRANSEHLGPFRPVLWVHWELAANLFAADPLAWRAARLLWCGLAAGMLLWLFRELKLPPAAALAAGAVAMWNPYRNEIWTSLTLAEGVAMPYALLGLVAARRAAHSDRPWKWDVLAAAGVLMALGCKNTYAALVPAQVALRLWPDGVGIREAWRRNGVRALTLTLTLTLPAAHFAYFKLNWHPGQYETHGPTLAQAGRILSAWKGAVGLDFVGAGLLLALVVVLYQSPRTAVRGLLARYRSALTAALLLLAAGFVAYLPMGMMSGRYTMPGVWGLDITLGLLLAALAGVPPTALRRVAVAGVAAGLVVLLAANVGRQEKVAARSRMLWAALEYVERSAPPGAAVAWLSGDSLKGELNVEEGIHFRWHLYHRGRGDVRVGLFAAGGKPVERVELPPLDGEPTYRIGGGPAGGTAFAAAYWAGRKRYVCYLTRTADTATARR
jgi:hypothetical protein